MEEKTRKEIKNEGKAEKERKKEDGKGRKEN